MIIDINIFNILEREQIMENVKGNLMVGEGVIITGSISVPGSIFVYGNVNGDVLANEIVVGLNGIVNGEVKVENAVISGLITNSILARDNLILRSTGKISGTLIYQSIEVENGGIIDGKIEKCLTGMVISMPIIDSSLVI